MCFFNPEGKEGAHHHINNIQISHIDTPTLDPVEFQGDLDKEGLRVF